MLNEKGHEVLDTTPIEMPIGFERPPTLQEMVRQYIRRELSERAAQEGSETFEDADNFDLPDEEPVSEHELRELEALPAWRENQAQLEALEKAEQDLIQGLRSRAKPVPAVGPPVAAVQREGAVAPKESPPILDGGQSN